MRVFLHWTKYQFKWQLKTLLLWSIILGFISFFVGWAYQPFSQSGYFDLVKNLPDYMKNAFLGSSTIATDLEGFLRMEYFSWMGLMFAFFPFVVGTSAIAGEIESNTIEPLMSKPLSRSQFYWGKFLVLALATLILILINFGCLWIGLKMINKGITMQEWTGSFVMMSLSTLTFVAIAFFFSVLFNVSRQAMTITTSLGIFEYLFNMIAGAVGKSAWAKWTIFYHADVGEIFEKHRIPLDNSLVILVMGVVLVIAGWVIFIKKDIS